MLQLNIVRGLNGTPKKRQFNDQMAELEEALKKLGRINTELEPVLKETEGWIKSLKKGQRLPKW